MKFDIQYGGSIEVCTEGHVFMTAEIKNRLKTHLSFYKNGKLILKSSLFAFFIWKRINIIYQDLPYPIDSFEQESTFRFCMIFNNSVVKLIQHPFKEAGYTYLINDVEVAKIFHSSKLRTGYETFTMVSDENDELINLYLLFAFLIHYHPS